MVSTLPHPAPPHKPPTSRHEAVMLDVLRASQLVADAGERLLRSYGLTPAQYNVLRILRGAGAAGLGRNAIRDRLLSRMPDVTRLLDRMEAAGLIRRERDGADRRCVPTHLTACGRALLDELDAPIAALHQGLCGHLSESQLEQLAELLALVLHPPTP